DDEVLADLYALALAGAGDTEGHRKACQALLERFGQTDGAETINRVAWTCVRVPNILADPSRLVKFAEKAVAVKPDNPICLQTLGAALYRAGRYVDSIQRLTKAQAREEPALAWLFLAMAHHRLGQAEQARMWLNKAVRQLDPVTQVQPPLVPTRGVHWDQWL